MERKRSGLTGRDTWNTRTLLNPLYKNSGATEYSFALRIRRLSRRHPFAQFLGQFSLLLQNVDILHFSTLSSLDVAYHPQMKLLPVT